MSLHHEIEIEDQAILHFFARDDGVDQAVVEEKFGGLEARRKFGLSGVFDDARPGETDHRARFGENEIADTGEAGHDTGVSWMGENADVGQFCLRMIRECAAGLCHLHEAEHAFVHARAAAGGNDDDREIFRGAEFDQASEFFADDGAHRTAEETEIHDAKSNFVRGRVCRCR